MVEKKDVKATVKAAAQAAQPAEAKAEAKPAVPEKVEAKAEAAVPVKAEAAPVEKEAKAAPAEKTTARKTASKTAEPKADVHFQFDGKDLVAKDVLDQAVKAFKKAHRGVEIKTIDLYIVANEGAAYYVVNGEGGDDYKIIL